MHKRYLSICIVVALVAGAGIAYTVTREAAAPAVQTKTPVVKPNIPETKPLTFDKTKLSTTDPASLWVVVNKQHPLSPTNYAPSDLVGVGNGQYLRADAAAALVKLFADAKTTGLTLSAASAYRSYDTQVGVYNAEVKNYGQDQADSESARPGYSEHQTGLAVDIGGGGCNIDDCFANTAEGKWTATNAYKYGYILRYPAGLTDVTGYRTEAWHFRYVGVELATEMHNQNVLTLEQFLNVTGGVNYNQ